MSDEYREIEVVEVGSGPPKPVPPPRTRSRTDLLLTLLVLGVFIGAACSAFTGWTVHRQNQEQHDLNCVYATIGSDTGEERDYDDLETYEQRIVDTLDCDVKGR